MGHKDNIVIDDWTPLFLILDFTEGANSQITEREGFFTFRECASNQSNFDE